jgi:hypothetical protein
MDLGVAVSAGTVKDKARARSKRLGRMPGLNVALLAEPGHPGLKKAGMDRAMGVVTVQAVFPYRRVLPEKRAALLGVALVTVFVDRVLGKQCRSGGAMGVVAVRAGHLPLPQGHVGGAQKLGSPLQVALKADL